MNATEFATKTVGTNGLEQTTDGYRYQGGNVNNCVTFNDETWRIIGIIPTEDTDGNTENRFKIINKDRPRDMALMQWLNCASLSQTGGKCTQNDGSVHYANDWTNSTMNAYLNTTYYNSLTTKSKNMIGTTRYYLGRVDDANRTPSNMLSHEKSGDYQNEEDKKIALMYASDYGYGASKACTTRMSLYQSDDNCKGTNNWLEAFTSKGEWTITKAGKGNTNAFYVGHYGQVSELNTGNLQTSILPAARPVLTLSSKVKISGGTGTWQSPYQLELSK